MKSRTTFFLLLICLAPTLAQALVVSYNPVAAGAGKPEVHIKPDGTMTIGGGKVAQIIGNSFFVVLQWGELPMRFTMKTNGETAVTKRYGGTATVPQIQVGDYLTADGDFFVGSDFFGLTARQIKDWSLQEESETYSGTITEVGADNLFTLAAPSKTLNLRLLNSAVIKKGTVVIPASRIAKGDSVVLADGVYDYASNTLTASSVVIFQARTDFLPRNYQGTLKSVSNTALPASLVITVEGVDYTVNISAGASGLDKNKKPALLARFVTGDTVRFYGALRETEKTLRDERIIDTNLIRNLNL